MRLSFEYFSPDDQYEALVARLVSPGCNWADVGCGRDIFPQNPALAAELSRRSGFLVGIDPSDNIRDNPYVSESFQGLVDDYEPTRNFNLVTLRMVAEHIADPDKALSSVSRMLKSGGMMVIYTPHKWAVISMLAAISPFQWHHPLKRLLWGGEERDTFPTAFKMNTRTTLNQYCQKYGLVERMFVHLDDCRTFGRFRALSWLELSLQRVLRGVGLGYPERCILAVFQKA